MRANENENREPNVAKNVYSKKKNEIKTLMLHKSHYYYCIEFSDYFTADGEMESSDAREVA